MAFSKSENERVRILCYLVIGGTAALFEWALVYLFAVRLGLNYLLSTGLAYLCSTVCHYIATNCFVFDSGVRYSRKKGVFPGPYCIDPGSFAEPSFDAPFRRCPRRQRHAE